MSNQKINKNEVRKEIASLIDSIKKQSDHIGFTREIPQVELDLIIHQIEHLYRKTIVFSYLNTVPEEQPVLAEVVEKPIQPQVQPVVLPQEVVALPVAPIVEITPAIAEITPPVIEPTPVVPEQKLESVTPFVDPILPVVPSASVEKIIEPEPVLEKISDPIPVPEKKITPEPNSTHFPDIKSMIGFNERIMFMRNLFSSDGAAYDEAMRQLNGCNSLAEATSFLAVLRNQYRWNPDSEACQTFQELVKRRFV
jgi:hypothetical protein